MNPEVNQQLVMDSEIEYETTLQEYYVDPPEVTTFASSFVSIITDKNSVRITRSNCRLVAVLYPLSPTR